MKGSIESFFAKGSRWHAEAAALRTILESAGLDEERKWGKPCYTHEGRNIAILQKMNDFLALMFFKGALLPDPKHLLEEQGENTHAARRLCFRSVADVKKTAPAVRRFVREAIAVEEKGVALPKRRKLVLADELTARLAADPALKAAFEALTPGRQRAYNLHIAAAKQSATRARRVEQHVPRILAGKGIRDD